jgi:hypothetical protein
MLTSLNREGGRSKQNAFRIDDAPDISTDPESRKEECQDGEGTLSLQNMISGFL